MVKRHHNVGAMKMVKGSPPDVPPQKGFRADRMIEMRKRRKLSQKELALRVGCSIRQIGRWEKRENEPDAFSLGRIAKALEVSADYLLGLVSDPSNLYTEAELSADERKVLTAFRNHDTVGWYRILGEWLKEKLNRDPDLTSHD
jgi:transcriptional regulator with XRE-family HTH domain